MSNRTKEDQSRASLPPGMLPKAERRALGKQAALKRAQAKRRKKILNNLAAVGIIAVVIGVVVAAMLGAFGGGPADPSASATPGASSSAPAGAGFELPEGMDPQLKTKPTVTAGTGDVTKLTVTTLVEGTGAAVASGQTITVNYVGVDYDTGEEFDSSWSRGETAAFAIGVGQVIPGWDQGLVGVKIGSRVQLDIPAELAYGEQSSGGPAGDLRFVVDIVGAS